MRPRTESGPRNHSALPTDRTRARNRLPAAPELEAAGRRTFTCGARVTTLGRRPPLPANLGLPKNLIMGALVNVLDRHREEIEAEARKVSGK